MKIEEFNVLIERENGDFVATLTFLKTGETHVTQGKHIQELYNRISEVLCLRLNNNAISEESE